MNPLRQKMMAGAAALLPAIMMSAAVGAAEPSYEGKRITLVITSGTGGSVDLMNRLGARHLHKHLPGRPSIISKNMTGAGGIVGMNYIYNQAPKDGTELGGSLMSVPYAPLFYGKGKKIAFDPLKLNWIGSPAKFVAVSIAWHTAPVKRWQDLLEKEMIVGSAGIGSSSTVDSILLRNILGFKFKVIMGYPSGSDIDLAMIRGETQGRATTAWAGITSRYPQWLTEKQVTILYQMGLEPHPTVPKDVPLLIDQIDDPEKKALLKLKMASYETGYPVYAPPGLPADVVAVLRKALAATYRDPEYLADAKRARVEVGPISGEKLDKIIGEAYGAPEELKEKLRQALRPDSVIEKVKPVMASATLSEVAKKGKVIAFEKDGKPTKARIGKGTKITVAGKKAKGPDLKAGMACDIEYYGDMGQAKAVSCK